MECTRKKMISILLFCARCRFRKFLEFACRRVFLEERRCPYHNVSALKDHFEVCVVEGKWSEVKNRKEQKQKHKKLFMRFAPMENGDGSRSSHVKSLSLLMRTDHFLNRHTSALGLEGKSIKRYQLTE